MAAKLAAFFLLQKQRHCTILLLYLCVQYNVLYKYFSHLTTLGDFFVIVTFLQADCPKKMVESGNSKFSQGMEICHQTP